MPTEYFEQRERALLGQRYEQLYAAPQQTAERGVTVSALRTTPEKFAQRADFPLEPSPFCKAAFVVHQPDFKPGRHPYHHAGVFYSQEPSASSAAPLLGVQPGMRVLDLCAAPGGKSSQLAAALQGRGVLVSNEYVAARAEILKSNLERMGVSNAVVLNETPARIAEALPEFFDRVLVDAPCSGEGMFRKEPVALQQHCEALVKQCAELGAQILDCAAAALAPGGQLVYSTCTFAPEEDEGQVAAFLQRHQEFALADVLGNVDYTFGSAGEENRTGGLPLDVSKVRRIWPCQGGEGHFMAKLQKAADAEVEASVVFLKWFTQPENNIAFAVGSGYLPVTHAANDMDAIHSSGLALTGSMENVLTEAVDAVNTNELYTTKAFEGGTDARSKLNYSMSDLATADRATVEERLAAGESAEEAEAEFLTDAYFEAWYQSLCDALSQYEG